ncbi:MAG: hypothetical protein VB878_14810 [Pirellulaceae bacterium]|jgi:hypothetical protein
MNPQDWFVGGMAAILGGILTYAATTDAAWFFELGKIRRLEGRIGRRGAKWVSIAIGLTLILLGGAIASGGKLNFSSSQERSNSSPSLD